MLTFGTFSPSLRTRLSRGRMQVKVFGAFSKAIYVQTPEQKLIMLHDKKCGLIPFGIGVCNFENDVIRKMNLQSGTEGIFVDGILSFERCEVSFFLREEVETGLSVDIPSQQERRKKTNMWCSYLAKHEKGAVLPLLGIGESIDDNLIARMAQKPILQLCHALLTDEQTEIKNSLLGLIGLGFGLTPSLDDVLNGIQYTLQYAERNWGVTLPGTKTMTEMIQTLAIQRTNPYSATYLISMASGEHFSEFEDFLGGQCFMSQEAGQKILEIGSSSGGDMMCGIIIALRLLEQKVNEMPT